MQQNIQRILPHKIVQRNLQKFLVKGNDGVAYAGERAAAVPAKIGQPVQDLLPDALHHLTGLLFMGEKTAVGSHIRIGGLTAEAAASLNQHGLCACLCRADGCGNPRRSATDHYNVIALMQLHAKSSPLDAITF